MGVIVISCIAGVLGGYLAFRAIGTDRLWEMLLAIVVGVVFGYTISTFMLMAVSSVLISGAYKTEVEREEIPVTAFTSQVTSTTYYTSQSDSGEVTTIRPTKGSSSRYSYIDGNTGEIEEVPTRNAVILVNENYDNTLIIVRDKFKPNTWVWYMFGDEYKVRERIFQLKNHPQGGATEDE